MNTLAGEAGIKIGPILLDTLVKHYFERILNSSSSQRKEVTQLRKDELLYDEAFNIVKVRSNTFSIAHPVEELQKFSNMRTPSPPWVLVVKVTVPMSCCDDAAGYLIKVLGGVEMTKRLVGGTKWWQVRGVQGVDAEWIASKRDWDNAEKKFKAHERERNNTGDSRGSESRETGVDPNASADYQPEMDEMRCILYAHGGGYYFGSVDQERYSIQRHARKIKGRVFAINYRLAPQYPFPCALQDLLAAYLFLIQPPEGASHRPVKPAHIVVAGDSAGGGLCIALLQVLRDTGLPLPAGGVLISPWCDLTHSFPSIHLNTATDVIPTYGLSLYKPSTLWPPPPEEITTRVQESVRSRIRHAVHLGSKSQKDADSHRTQNEAVHNQDGHLHDIRLPYAGQTLRLGSTASLPSPNSNSRDQTICCQTADGKTLTITDQIHLYAPNYLLRHPLISPVVSYLGGLPPLLVIAGEKEVLRDEIIYFAHKAAHPDSYPVKEDARAMYPPLQDIEKRFGPTPVHLQVYDDAAHVLPVLFSFTTPAKYCYRAIATFIKHVTGMLPSAKLVTENVEPIPVTGSPPSTPDVTGSPQTPLNVPELPRMQSTPVLREDGVQNRNGPFWNKASNEGLSSRNSLRRALSASVARASSKLVPRHNGGGKAQLTAQNVSPSGREPSASRDDSVDVAGPRFHAESSGGSSPDRTAGEASVYDNGMNVMIRERVSTRGVVRPLEPESELAAFSLPQELIGVVSELAIRRYLDGRTKFDKKFKRAAKAIARHRKRNLELAKQDAANHMTRLQHYLAHDDEEKHRRLPGVKEALLENGSWSWAWALDADEHPPPSSIVARRDTKEAVRLARIADQSVLVDENTMSGNNLWSMVVNFLTITPDKRHSSHQRGDKAEGREQPHRSKRERFRSLFAQFAKDQQKTSNASSKVNT
ncbi:alpha/beta-hydrolase [Panus rudis PR-1116 ss-1]|nr:alpha/beta-hydrolase [Panus rudis PR-1116 ss-1]